MKSSDTAAARRHGVYFEPDILKPFQYAQANRRRDHLHPEKKLMFAVLTDAIECFRRHISTKSRRGQKIFAEAENWISSRDELSLFSFEHVCEALDLDSGYLRTGLMRWRADQQAAPCSYKRIRESLRYHYRVRNPRLSAARARDSQ